MLRAKLHPAGKESEAINIWGQVPFGDHYWHVNVWLFERPDHSWRVGPYDCPRWESVNRFFRAAKVWGRPYQPSSAVKLEIFKAVDWLFGHMSKDEILRSEVKKIQTTIEYGPMAPTVRVIRRVHMDNNETKQVEVVRTQCTAVPAKTAKAVGRCPRFMTKVNEFGLCGSHDNFYHRGAEIKLIDGRILNEKPAAESKPETKNEAGRLVIPEGMTAVVVDKVTPENVAKAVKKVSKKAKVQQALAVLKAKDAAKAAAVPVEILAPVDQNSDAIGMLNRTIKS